MDLFNDNIENPDLVTITRLFRESQSAFLNLFNNSPVCMSMTTTTLGKRVYVRVNKKFLEKFGFSEEEIIGRTSVEIGILDHEESVKVGEIIKEKGRLQNDYVKCLTKSGGIVHTISSIELMEMNGETYLVSFFVDVTKIVEQQAIIEQYAQQLESVNRELNSFSFSVSHDLRAPLRAINGYSALLLESLGDVLDDDGKMMLNRIVENGRMMDRLINDLLAFAKLGQKPIMVTGIDMNALVKEILVDLKEVYPHKAEVRLSPLHSARGDRALIKQVLINLLSNGIKYSSKRENPIVEIFSEIMGNHVVYSVKDNGAGFDMQYADKLFGVFQRLHNISEFEGTGIGLAIVQRIISKHGGTVNAISELNKGATFSFTLPL